MICCCLLQTIIYIVIYFICYYVFIEVSNVIDLHVDNYDMFISLPNFLGCEIYYELPCLFLYVQICNLFLFISLYTCYVHDTFFKK